MLRFTIVAAAVIVAVVVIAAADQSSQPENPSCIKADILLVVDTSSSISVRNIAELKKRLITFAAKFPVGVNSVGFAAITFGSIARKAFDFPTGSANVSDTQRQISRIPEIRGFTVLQGGLNGAIIAFNPSTDDYANVYEARYQLTDVAKVVIVFTDGNPTDPEKTAVKAALLRSIPNINIYAVGVGNKVNQTQLYEIASAPNNVFIVPDFFDSLTTVLENLSQTICSLVL